MGKRGSTLIRSGRTVVNADRERAREQGRYLSVSSPRRVEPRDVEGVHARGVAADDLRLLVVRHARQDLGQDLPGLGEGGLAVGVVGAPHHVVDADHVAQADADRVLLEAQEDVAVEEVARAHVVLEAVERLAVALAVRVVHGGEHVRRPGQLELHDGERSAG